MNDLKTLASTASHGYPLKFSLDRYCALIVADRQRILGTSMKFLLLFASTVLALTVRQALAEEVKVTSSCSVLKSHKECSFGIEIKGEIIASTIDELRKAFTQRDEMLRREGVSGSWGTTSINSPGGSVYAAIEIGRLFRSRQQPIWVKREDVCVSACVLILAGATYRTLEGQVGIHRPYLETPKTDVNVGQMQRMYVTFTEQIRAYLREMNVSDRLADDMMIVPPEKVRFLSANELGDYGLGPIDPVTKETQDVNEARKLGLDRQEYMRRKARSETLCAGVVSYWECVEAVLSGKR
jgi:hypothetical protein